MNNCNTDNIGIYKTNEGMVKNIQVEDVFVFWKDKIGLVAVENKGLIENISVTGVVAGEIFNSYNHTIGKNLEHGKIQY